MVGSAELTSAADAALLPFPLLQDPLQSGILGSAVLQHNAAFKACGTSLLLLPNSRTPGASGAWNTGLLAAMSSQMSSRAGVDPCADTYVAILGKMPCGTLQAV